MTSGSQQVSAACYYSKLHFHFRFILPTLVSRLMGLWLWSATAFVFNMYLHLPAEHPWIQHWVPPATMSSTGRAAAASGPWGWCTGKASSFLPACVCRRLPPLWVRCGGDAAVPRARGEVWSGASRGGHGKYPTRNPGGSRNPRSWRRAIVFTSHLNPSLSGHISDPCQEQGGKGGLRACFPYSPAILFAACV